MWSTTKISDNEDKSTNGQEPKGMLRKDFLRNPGEEGMAT